jgi:hypothetical protein
LRANPLGLIAHCDASLRANPLGLIAHCSLLTVEE